MENAEKLKEMIKKGELASYNIDEEVMMNKGDAVMRCKLTVWYVSDRRPHLATGFSYGKPKDIKKLADDALGEALNLVQEAGSEDSTITLDKDESRKYLEGLIN